MDTIDPAVPAALLEREHEVERVRSVLQEVARQAGGVLLIEGAAGIGKSRLVEGARVRASELGIRVLSARATELEQGFPFGVMRQLFERPLPQRVLALSLAVEHRPGNALHVDREAPVPQSVHVIHDGLSCESREQPFSPWGEGARRVEDSRPARWADEEAAFMTAR